MYNLLVKCLEKILRAKNGASLTFEKSFFEQLILVRRVICLKSTKIALNCRRTISTCHVMLYFIPKHSLRSKECFCIHIVLVKCLEKF